jgi:hypothetical protein
MRVLALDLAIGRTGWAVLNQVATDELATLVTTGIISPPSTKHVGDMLRGQAEYARGSLGMRQYSHLTGVLDDLVATFGPQFVAYEYPARPFHHRSKVTGARNATAGTEFNAMRALANAEAWVEAWMAEHHRGMRLVSVPVHEAKAFVTGMAGGRAHQDAPKDRVARLIESHWKMKDLVDASLMANGTPKLDRNTKQPEMKYDRSDAVSVGLTALYWTLWDAEQAVRVAQQKAATLATRATPVRATRATPVRRRAAP